MLKRIIIIIIIIYLFRKHMRLVKTWVGHISSYYKCYPNVEMARNCSQLCRLIC
jgi:hypothetical protein